MFARRVVFRPCYVQLPRARGNRHLPDLDEPGAPHNSPRLAWQRHGPPRRGTEMQEPTGILNPKGGDGRPDGLDGHLEGLAKGPARTNAGATGLAFGGRPFPRARAPRRHRQARGERRSRVGTLEAVAMGTFSSMRYMMPPLGCIRKFCSILFRTN